MDDEFNAEYDDNFEDVTDDSYYNEETDVADAFDLPDAIADDDSVPETQSEVFEIMSNENDEEYIENDDSLHIPPETADEVIDELNDVDALEQLKDGLESGEIVVDSDVQESEPDVNDLMNKVDEPLYITPEIADEVVDELNDVDALEQLKDRLESVEIVIDSEVQESEPDVNDLLNEVDEPTYIPQERAEEVIDESDDVDTLEQFKDDLESGEIVVESDAQELESIENSPIEEDVVSEIEDNDREYDDFEREVLEDNPDFYDTGIFYEQGVNEFGYVGTCGPTSQANTINELFNSNELTENKVLNIAVDNNLCTIDGSPEECGGTTTDQFMELYDKVNEGLDDKINVELFEYDNALSMEEVAGKLDEGSIVNVTVIADALWGEPIDDVDPLGAPRDAIVTDHWITVTGVERDDVGNIQGFNIIDSGGGEDYVSADRYQEMCFGTETVSAIDPTSIVVSKKE